MSAALEQQLTQRVNQYQQAGDVESLNAMVNELLTHPQPTPAHNNARVAAVGALMALEEAANPSAMDPLVDDNDAPSSSADGTFSPELLAELQAEVNAMASNTDPATVAIRQQLQARIAEANSNAQGQGDES